MGDVLCMKDIQVDRISYGDVITRNFGVRSVPILYDGKPLVVRLDRVEVPFGVSIFPNPNYIPNTPRKYSLNAYIGGSDKLNEFAEILKKIDELNLKYCLDNKLALSPDSYKSMIGMSKLKIKLPFTNNHPNFQVFGPDATEIPLLQNGDPNLTWANNNKLRIIAELEGLWVTEKNIFCNWSTSHIMVLPPKKTISPAVTATETPAVTPAATAAVTPAANAAETPAVTAGVVPTLKRKRGSEDVLDGTKKKAKLLCEYGIPPQEIEEYMEKNNVSRSNASLALRTKYKTAVCKHSYDQGSPSGKFCDFHRQTNNIEKNFREFQEQIKICRKQINMLNKYYK